jgi:hypothetical protein
MMQTNREAALEFARGAAVGLGIVGLFVLLIYIQNPKPSPQKGDPSRFQIVDKYKGCDVVRWEQKGLAEYKYFLDCGR